MDRLGTDFLNMLERSWIEGRDEEHALKLKNAQLRTNRKRQLPNAEIPTSKRTRSAAVMPQALGHQPLLQIDPNTLESPGRRSSHRTSK